jgi:hypothetical protein
VLISSCIIGLLLQVNNAGTVGTTTEIGNPETFWHEVTSQQCTLII